MEAILILLTVLATVSSRNIPSTDYVPSIDQLQQIFGNDPPSQTKTETHIDKPAKDPIHDTSGTNNTKLHLKKDSNGKQKLEHPEKVELNIKINVDTDCDKGIAITENVTVIKNINSTGDGGGSKQGKVGAGKGVAKVDRCFDDRVALGVDSCPTGEVRVGAICVEPA